MLKRPLLFFFVAVFVSLSALAQSGSGKATGTVYDETGEPLPDVAVTVVGTTKGISTDLDGKFTLNGLKKGDKLKFSYVGMVDEIIVFADDGKALKVTLKEDSQTLDEVTVVAFGKQKKESLVSSIESVNTKELRVPSSNLTQALSGRIAGVISFQTSGEPGKDDATFFIRGIATFGTTEVKPLILIDNIEVESSDLAKMHPDDLEAFSVLKDATATALYGARGANGVILVTTKSGQEGKMKLSFRLENSFSSNTTDIKLADPITYMELANEATATRSPMSILPYPQSNIVDTRNQTNPYVFPTTDWIGELTRSFASNQRANINVSGGGKVARYYVALSVSQDNGTFTVDKRNNFNNELRYIKYLIHSNVNVNLTPTTELISRLHGAFDQSNGPLVGGSELYQQVMKVSPVRFPAYFPAELGGYYQYANHILFGNYGGNAQYLNPYAELLKGYNESSTSMMMAQLELHQNFKFLLNGLTGRLLLNTKRNAGFNISRQYVPFYYQVDTYDRPSNTFTIQELNVNTGTEYLNFANGSRSLDQTLYGEASINYSGVFNLDHTVSAMLVGTMRELKGNSGGNIYQSLPARNLSLSGRATYNFLSRYFVEFNFGYNGSEKFAVDHRWGFFPSYGIGWIASNEAFWEPIKKAVSLLKFRYTYGLVGNDNIGDQRFFYMWSVTPGGGLPFTAGYYGNGWSGRGYYIASYANPNITWEISYKHNLGIEIGFFNKLNITTDIYKEDRENILQPRADIPIEMGLWASQYMNVGKAKAYGIDFAVDYKHSINKDWWATGKANFTYGHGEYVYYEEPNYELAGTPWMSKIGRTINQPEGYVAERLFMDDKEASIYNNAGSRMQNLGGEYLGGDILYRDVNGDKWVDDKDIVPMGFPTTPEINYGFGLSTGYKRCDLSVFFQGSGNQSFFINYGAMSPFVIGTYSGRVTENALAQFIVDDHWTELNQNPYAKWPRLSNSTITNNSPNSTYWLRHQHYLRFKSFEFGYALPDNIVNRLNIGGLRFYVSGTNLGVWSSFKDWDPELGGNGLNYPLQMVINVGLNVSL